MLWMLAELSLVARDALLSPASVPAPTLPRLAELYVMVSSSIPLGLHLAHQPPSQRAVHWH